MLFSEWLRNQTDRQDHVGEVARRWNALPPKERKGRINATRLTRMIGTPIDDASKVIQEHQDTQAI